MAGLPAVPGRVRVLLDAHAFLWSADQVERLPASVYDLISDARTRVVVSVATTWELTLKALFNEELGVVIQVRTEARNAVMQTLRQARHRGISSAELRAVPRCNQVVAEEMQTCRLPLDLHGEFMEYLGL